MILKSHLGPEFNVIIDQIFLILFSLVVHLDPGGQDAYYIHF